VRDLGIPETPLAKGTLLVVDDDPSMCAFLSETLRSQGYDVAVRHSGPAALEVLAAGPVDVVLTDLRMPTMDGHHLCREIHGRYADVPVIVLTAFGSMEMAVDAIRAGAYDFLSKPASLASIEVAVKRAVEHRNMKRDIRSLRKSIDESRGFGDLVGESLAMQHLHGMMHRVADSDVSVLITGESGTGKEVVARALHRSGPNAAGAFVAINCAAMPEALLEAELFGYEKGAFTDAKTSRSGLFLEANGGTLFLDELGDMPLGLQGKLLRALQERTVRPVGARNEVPFSARVLTATNRDLPTLIEEGRFREDLYFRINVIQLDLPPLRARTADILPLAKTFLAAIGKRTGKAIAGIEQEAAVKLLGYPWPGNVRELHNIMERAVALGRFEQITLDDLPDRVSLNQSSSVALGAEDVAVFVTLAEAERRYILRVLDEVKGNRTMAAKILGMDRTTLWRRLDQYDTARVAKPSPA
jgi:DNA-binding NtrC family response regulator